MPTISHHLTEHLATLGIYSDDASAVLDAVQAQMPSMAQRWLDDTSGYSPQLLDTLCLAAKGAAAEYLGTHKPAHFALSQLG
jgi:hypothetical protein